MTKPIEDPMQNFAAFIDSIGLSEGWTSDGLLSIDQAFLPLDPVIPSEPELRDETTTAYSAEDCPPQRYAPEEALLSNFGSRLPSLQPEIGESEDTFHNSGDTTDTIGLHSTRNIRDPDYRSFIKNLRGFQRVLVQDFSPPSRFTLSRFLHGFLDGLNEHLPFVHAPTLQVGSCNPALVLAVAACGAQYRFENNKGKSLFYAARAIIQDILREKGYGMPSNFLPGSMRTPCSQGTDFWSQFSGGTGNRPDEAVEIIQTLLLLVIHATWGGEGKVAQESMLLQDSLASCVRAHGLKEMTPNFNLTDDSDEANWYRWVRDESNRRTLFVVYCFLNLHSLMYNTPPLILNSELGLNMPCSAELWSAHNASAWRLVYDGTPNGNNTQFQISFASLFTETAGSGLDRMSPTALGNHVLLHALSQQLYFARQLCLLPLEHDSRPHSETGMDAILHTWKSRWKETPGSSTDPRNPAGPIAFTSAALLGQIYVRLQVDLGPHRALMTRDPPTIAQALAGAPRSIVRGPGLITALLHAVHALSIPIQLGIDFVARTYSFHWSVQHCLSALEYAYLLTTWLLALPEGGLAGLSHHEKTLFLWITRLLDETDMGLTVPMESRLELTKDPRSMRKLGCSIIRVWAGSFNGNMCWGMVDVVSASLKGYADLLETN